MSSNNSCHSNDVPLLNTDQRNNRTPSASSSSSSTQNNNTNVNTNNSSSTSNKRPLVEDEEEYNSSLNSGGCQKKPKVAAMAELNVVGSSNRESGIDVEPKSPQSPQGGNNIKANFSLIASQQNGIHKNSSLNQTKTGGSKKIVIKNFKGDGAYNFFL